MKPYDMVSSHRGANTLLQGQQINGHNTEEITEDSNRQIKTAAPKRDQHRSQKTRSQEIQG
jgi:hypothetical protein